MARGNLTFEQPLGRPRSEAALQRQATLLQAMPKVEEHFARLSRDRRVRSQKMSSRDADEALRFYNKVVADGRYVDLLNEDPELAARKLGLTIRPDVVAILRNTIGSAHGPGPAEGPIEAVIAVAVVIVKVIANPADGVVIDASAKVGRKL